MAETMQPLTRAFTPEPTPLPPLDEIVASSLAEAGETTGRFLQSLPLIGTRLAFAALVILAGYVVLRLGRKLLGRIIRNKENAAHRTVQQRETFRSLVESVFSYVMYFIIVTAVLSIFGVDVTSIIAVAGVGGVAIGFGAQTLVKDVISGVFLWAEGNITVGDTVQINAMTGVVESISLRTTMIRDFNGNLYTVPNGDIRTVANMSRNYKRAVIDIRLNYEEDFEWMLDILRDEMQKARDAAQDLHETPQILGVTAMAGDSITVQITALCDPDACMEMERMLRRRIINRFEKEGILFPHGPIMPTPRKERGA